MGKSKPRPTRRRVIARETVDCDRRRELGDARREFFRELSDPIGGQLGPTADPAEGIALISILNPRNEARPRVNCQSG